MNLRKNLDTTHRKHCRGQHGRVCTEGSAFGNEVPAVRFLRINNFGDVFNGIIL